MPSRPAAHTWPCHIWFLAYGTKPQKRKLPGLQIMPPASYPSGLQVWRCFFEGLLSN